MRKKFTVVFAALLLSLFALNNTGCKQLHAPLYGADSDGDGVPDSEDKCPTERGSKAYFGCLAGSLEIDQDMDGVLDSEDKCPTEKGDKAHQGCPFIDSDGDGIEDSRDKCPKLAEDMNSINDEDGCPDADTDGDGLADYLDKCPKEAETYNEYKDGDGCPEPDSDGDGIPDALDKCPDKPETINGIDDSDGCPDKGKTKIILTKTKIEILEKVFFETGKSKIRKKSFNLLDQVAAVLNNYKKISKLRVEGHTDNVGKDADNIKLSQERSEAVRDYLISKGVSRKRLVAKGYGEHQPIAPNNTSKGRQKNRRVEFTIVSLNGKPVETNHIVVTNKKEKKE